MLESFFKTLKHEEVYLCEYETFTDVVARPQYFIEANHRSAAQGGINMIVINEAKCVGCGYCNIVCPTEALKAWGVNQLDEEKCTDCLECIDYCPTNALEEKE